MRQEKSLKKDIQKSSFHARSLLVLCFQSFYFRPCCQVYHLSGTSAAPVFWCQGAAHCPVGWLWGASMVLVVPMAAESDHSTCPCALFSFSEYKLLYMKNYYSKKHGLIPNYQWQELCKCHQWTGVKSKRRQTKGTQRVFKTTIPRAI